MVEKRARKLSGVVREIAAPALEGADDAEVTLVGWGSTRGVIKEAVAQLDEAGVAANQLAIKWIVPFHARAVSEALAGAKRVIVVENNHSGQFYRYLRSETGLDAHGHIRKYDGEPFMPHHIVDGVQALLAGKTDRYVPDHEVMV
jgi:2-oxoglutarate ferredoxin oxidoreductase subunit alpha